MAKIKTNPTTGQWLFLCPGCTVNHILDSRWTFNMDFERPTFKQRLKSISIVKSKDGKQSANVYCHAKITDGKITYEPDSSHRLKGQTVDLPDVPEEQPAAVPEVPQPQPQGE